MTDQIPFDDFALTGREGWPRHAWHDGRRLPVHVACAACGAHYTIHGGPVPPKGWVCGLCREGGHVATTTD